MAKYDQAIDIFRTSLSSLFEKEIQIESRYIECQMNEINFLISLAWAEGGRDVGDQMLNIEKCYEGVRAPPTPFDILCILTRSVGEGSPELSSFHRINPNYKSVTI